MTVVLPLVANQHRAASWRQISGKRPLGSTVTERSDDGMCLTVRLPWEALGALPFRAGERPIKCRV